MEIDGGRGTGYTKGGIYAGRRNRYVVTWIGKCIIFAIIKTLRQKKKLM